MEATTQTPTLTPELVLQTVRTNPGKTAAEIRRLINIAGTTKSDINKILYRLSGKTLELKHTNVEGETPIEAPTWHPISELGTSPLLEEDHPETHEQ